jgi:hypothetical protein
MRLATALLCLCCGWAVSPAQTVTETKWVDSGKGRQLLRKINGRWWTQDNREIYPPSKGGVFWEVDSKPGVCRFFHHRPFQLERAETLHLFMSKQEVAAVLGPPNRIFGTGDHGFWYYYAANGTKLQVRFMDDGVLGEAKYYAIGERSWPVASIESERNGRSIYSMLADRATKRSRGSSAHPVAHSSVIAVESPQIAATGEPEQPTPKRAISAEALSTVKGGETRRELIDRLGQPAFRSSIESDEGTRESLTYTLESGDQVVIHVVDGIVIEESR